MSQQQYYGQQPPPYYPPPQQGGYGYPAGGGQPYAYGPPQHGGHNTEVVYVKEPKHRSSGMSKSDCCLIALCAACFGCCVGDCLDCC